jgi:hypothetical protein
MMEMTYEQRLRLMHQLCQAQARSDDLTEAEAIAALANTDIEDSAHYLASFLTFRAIQSAGRHPADELQSDFDMLGVYQCFGLMIYAFLFMPLTQEGMQPDYGRAQVTISKTLFDGLPAEQLAEIIESGFHKFKLIAEAESEHWQEYRENLDKVTISYMIATTDDDSPHSAEEVLPLFGQLLSQLCEAFTAD